MQEIYSTWLERQKEKIRADWEEVFRTEGNSRQIFSLHFQFRKQQIGIVSRLSEWVQEPQRQFKQI